jgi:DNA-binding NarL/FixJ family response regulator
VRILVADDHPGFPEVEERLLEREFEIVGKVRNGQALIEQAIQLEPDVIVTDISMPILNGIAAVQRLKDSKCKSQIIFLTVHADRDFVRMCLSTGALGYVLKPHMAKELKRAILAVLEGRMFVSPDLRHETAS